jgi:hypothetical protein
LCDRCEQSKYLSPLLPSIAKWYKRG